MATTAARPGALAAVAAGLVVAAACIRVEPVDVGPEPAPIVLGPAAGPAMAAAPTGGPVLRVGLTVGRDRVEVLAPGGATVLDLSGAFLGALPVGRAGVARTTSGGVALEGAEPGGRLAGGALVLVPDSNAALRIGGRAYRGDVVLLRDREGVTVINRLPLETYLVGVVGAELGRRDSTELEALRAQAIVARTYALRNRGRWEQGGFDVYATVADQVYGGTEVESPLARRAVADTRGLVLAHGGELIDAFFHSTCGGRTAEGREVFAAADRPYLRSVPDVDEQGQAWCRISPRYRWREEWSQEALRAALQRTLPGATGTPAAAVSAVRHVEALERTGSGRVTRLAITLPATTVRVDGQAIRQVLRTPAGEPLRSQRFTLRAERQDGRVARLVVEGEGFGHGVGFCQWGGIARARAGQSYATILAAYYPGTTLDRLY